MAVASSLYRDHFRGERVVVTGAARGIGAGIAQAFAEAGASVLLADRDPAVTATADDLRSAGSMQSDASST